MSSSRHAPVRLVLLAAIALLSARAVLAQADLALTKTDGTDPVEVGAIETYTITLTNGGPSAAADVVLSDMVPTGTSVVMFSQIGGTSVFGMIFNAGTNTFTASTASFPAGETATFSMLVQVNGSVAHGSTVTNTATVTSATADPDSTNNSASATTTIHNETDLVVTKIDATDPIDVGAIETYTIAMTNNGPLAAANVVLSDVVPAGTSAVMFHQTSGASVFTLMFNAGTNTFTASVASFPAGETATFSMAVQVNGSVPHGSTITNTASVTSAASDPTPANNADSETTTVTNQTDLAVTKTDGTDPISPGEIETYTLTVTNAGPMTATNVVLSDTVPTGTAAVAFTQISGPVFAASFHAGTNTFRATRASLDVGETATFSLMVQVYLSAVPMSTITNTATVTSAGADSAPANDTATVTTTVEPPPTDLAITKTSSGASGANVTYTITVRNNGPATAYEVAVTDTLPAATTLVSATPSAGTCTPGASSVVCNLGTLLNGATATITLVIAVPPGGGMFTNTASVTHFGDDPNAGNDTATAVVALAGSNVPALSRTLLLLLAMMVAAAGYAATR